MGIDGRLLFGDSILINPYYMPKHMFNFLTKLSYKYSYLFEYNYMDGIDRNKEIIIWGETPTILFLVDTVNRRPLIINNKEQLSFMRPVCIQNQCELNLDNIKIWMPSYTDFTIQ